MESQIKSEGKGDMKNFYIWHSDRIYKDLFFDSWLAAAKYATKKNIDLGDFSLIANFDGIALIINDLDDSELEMTYAELRNLDLVELSKTHAIITEV